MQHTLVRRVAAAATTIALTLGGVIAVAQPATAAAGAGRALPARARRPERSATDASGSGRDGTYVGGATLTGGEGVRLDGADDHVKLPNNLLAGLTSITVSAEVLIRGAQADAVLHLRLRQHRRGRRRQRLPVLDGQLVQDLDRHRQLVDRADGEQRREPGSRRVEDDHLHARRRHQHRARLPGRRAGRAEHERHDHARLDRRRRDDRQLPRAARSTPPTAPSPAASATCASTTPPCPRPRSRRCTPRMPRRCSATPPR